MNNLCPSTAEYKNTAELMTKGINRMLKDGNRMRRTIIKTRVDQVTKGENNPANQEGRNDLAK